MIMICMIDCDNYTCSDQTRLCITLCIWHILKGKLLKALNINPYRIKIADNKIHLQEFKTKSPSYMMLRIQRRIYLNEGALIYVELPNLGLGSLPI